MEDLRVGACELRLMVNARRLHLRLHVVKLLLCHGRHGLRLS